MEIITNFLVCMIVELSYYDCFLKHVVDGHGQEEATETQNEQNQMQHVDHHDPGYFPSFWLLI